MSYVDAKLAALRQEPYYDYLVGPGYEEIPVSRIYAGFAAANDDLRGTDADADPMRHKNLPQFRGALGESHPDDGTAQGYYMFPEEVKAMDLAPDFVKARIPGFGQIARCIRAEQSLPLNELLNTQVAVGETNAQPVFRGNPIGLLYEPPFLGHVAQGRLPPVGEPK